MNDVTLFLSNMKPSTLSMALSLVLISGCMPNQKPDAWLEDKDLVIQSLQDAHANNAKLVEKFGALDHRILSLESMNAKQAAKIKAMEAKLTKNKVSKKAFPTKKKKIKSKSKILNQRLDNLSAKLNPTAVKTPSTSKINAEEKNAYTAAYLALKSGRYDESSYGFSAVIQKHPDGEYTDQAYYWLGESLVAQHRNKEAVEAFKLVANKYKSSPKHAAALLKLASVYQGLKNTKQAKITLKRVIKDHPDSRSAERARIQLDNLSKANGARK